MEILNEYAETYLPKIQDKSVALILIDPPYGMIRNTQTWDTVPDWIFIKRQFERILQDNGQLYIFGKQPMMSDLYQDIKDIFEFRFEIIWNKEKGIWASNYQPIGSHELIWCFKKSRSRATELKFYPDRIKTPGKPYKKWNRPKTSTVRSFETGSWTINTGGRFPKSVITHSPIYKGHEEYLPHPTQKPEAIIRWILESSTDPGDTVMDCYLGSGTTAAVALKLDRNFTGCEKDPEYFKMTMERIKEIENQKKL